MDGFYTQRAFRRVQEHPKRSSDEEVMRIRSRRVNIVQGLRYSMESHALACQRVHQPRYGVDSTPRRARGGTQPRYCMDSTPRRTRGGTQQRYGVDSMSRRAKGCLGSFGTRPFSTRNHPGTALVHRRQYPPNLDHMICHKQGTKTILQSIPIHPKSRNKPTSISIHIFLISILKTKTTIQRGKNPIPRCKSYNSTHILYKTKDPYKFHTRIHTKLQRSIQVLLITFCVHIHVSCLFHMEFHILVQYDVYVFTHHSYILIPYESTLLRNWNHSN